MDLEDLRLQIDEIDDKIVELIEKRMDVAAGIAKYKKENNLPVLNSKREREKLNDVSKKSREETQSYMRVLYSLMFELSRSYQNRLLNTNTQVFQNVMNAIENTPKLFPQSPKVACQGVEGAYSQLACEKLFKNPEIMYINNFEGVFSAIESGLCDYGILPLENSTAGSVNDVYDLMISHNFNIIRSVRLKLTTAYFPKKAQSFRISRKFFLISRL